MNTAQLDIWQLAFQDMAVHFEVDPPADISEAKDRLTAVAYDALAAIDKLEQAK